MKKLSRLGAVVLAVSTLVACDGSKPSERQEAPSTKSVDITPYVDPSKSADKPADKPAESPAPAGSAAGSAAPTTSPTSDLPAECQDYKAAVDQMNACEKFGATKTKLAEEFGASWTAWEKLPADAKAKLAAQCKQSADSIRNVGRAACGW